MKVQLLKLFLTCLCESTCIGTGVVVTAISELASVSHFVFEFLLKVYSLVFHNEITTKESNR